MNKKNIINTNDLKINIANEIRIKDNNQVLSSWNVNSNDIWVSYTCINCGSLNLINVGQNLLDGNKLVETAEWQCPKCGALHNRDKNASINILNKGLEDLGILVA